MGDWIIRRAQQRDAPALSACIDAAYAEYAGRIADLPDVSADCAGEIARYQLWLAEIGNHIVGGLVLIPEAGFMRCANVAVHPDHRGAGLGRALMTLAETESLAQGYRELRLTTHAEVPDNVALYAHLGWQSHERHGNKILMRKML